MSEFNKDKSIYFELLEFTKQVTLVELLGSGIDVNFIGVIVERINLAITGGDNIVDLIDELDGLINGTTQITTDKRVSKGLLDRYMSQVLSDSISQFAANYNQMLTNDLGFEFYLYAGNEIKSTRPFCSRYKMKYYHRKEIEDLGEKSPTDPFTGLKLSTLSSKENNLLAGRIPNTTPSNIFTRRGGYNCRHQWSAVSNRFVPKETLLRALEKGFFTPSPKERKKLGI